MHTIALISRKGGTGKSTLAIGLAVAAMEAGHRVCLLEADPSIIVSGLVKELHSVPGALNLGYRSAYPT